MILEINHSYPSPFVDIHGTVSAQLIFHLTRHFDTLWFRSMFKSIHNCHRYLRDEWSFFILILNNLHIYEITIQIICQNRERKKQKMTFYRYIKQIMWRLFKKIIKKITCPKITHDYCERELVCYVKLRNRYRKICQSEITQLVSRTV